MFVELTDDLKLLVVPSYAVCVRPTSKPLIVNVRQFDVFLRRERGQFMNRRLMNRRF